MSHEDRLRKLIQQIAKEQNYNDYKLSIKEVSSDGANYTSKLFKMTVTEANKPPLNLFGKVATFNRTERTVPEDIKIYNTERFLYTKLSHIYRSIEDNFGVTGKHRLEFSKYYGSNPTLFEETIVLEDLTSSGWSSYNRFKSIDWPYATAAVKEMVKLHALSFAYSEMDPQAYEVLLKNLEATFGGDMDNYMAQTVVTAMREIRPENKKLLEKCLENHREKIKKLRRPLKRAAITHGDYRCSNLMHKVNKDGSVDIKIVDLQTLQGGSPVVDLLYFIFTGSDSAFREQYYERLIDHYYTELEAAMKRLKLDPKEIYSKEDFHSELKEKLPFGLTIAVFALPVVTVDKENAPQVNENMELSAFSVAKTSALYTERLNGVVDDYIKWGVLT
ncbi:uncharacterized protein LOC142979873 isoform X2 [Anticarsia gemmatalis]|uniref:uncharacterized protein LOC142979873 isoform X2 n=1 Tax=Anticarsia gemmatalis TaxID=129554 RepID=UPI003F767B9D